jgi:hypothetical protein
MCHCVANCLGVFTLAMSCSEKHFREDRNGLIKPNCKGRLRWRRTVRLLVGSADSTESREGCLRVLKLPFRIKTGQRCRRILSPDKRLVPGRRLSRSSVYVRRSMIMSLENLEMSEGRIIFPLQFMGNVIPPTGARGERCVLDR